MKEAPPLHILKRGTIRGTDYCWTRCSIRLPNERVNTRFPRLGDHRRYCLNCLIRRKGV